MPHIPDLGLKLEVAPADASKSGNARVRHPRMYRLGTCIGWVIVAAVILACAVLTVAVVTALAHLYWRVTDAVWRLT